MTVLPRPVLSPRRKTDHDSPELFSREFFFFLFTFYSFIVGYTREIFRSYDIRGVVPEESLLQKERATKKPARR